MNSDQDKREKIEHEWAFEPGDLIADEIIEHDRMPGLGTPESDGDDHDYEVIRRMFDADDGGPMYLVEKPNYDQLVFTAATIRTTYEKVGEADDDE